MNKIQPIHISKYRGYSAKEPSKLPEGLLQTLQDMDVRNFNAVKGKGFSTPVIDGAEFSSDGLTALTRFTKFRSGQAAPNDLMYIAQDGQKIMKWNGTSWAQIDAALSNTLGTVRFLERNGALIAATGNDASNQPEWYGYVPDRWNNAYTGTLMEKNNSTGGFVVKNANVEVPDVNDYINAVTVCKGAHFIPEHSIIAETDEVRYYKVAVQYNNSTWSPLSINSIIATFPSDGNYKVNVHIQIDPTVIDDRITGIRVYASDNEKDYYRILDNNFNDDWVVPHANFLGTPMLHGSYVDGTGVITRSIDVVIMVDDLYNNCLLGLPGSRPDSDEWTVLEPILDTGNNGAADTITIASGKGYDSAPGNPFWSAPVSGWWHDGSKYNYALIDHTDDLELFPVMMVDLGYTEGEDVTINYGIISWGGGRMFVARVYKGGETYNSRVYFSHIDPNGVYQYDVFRDANYIDTGALGVHNIKALQYDNQHLYIFGESAIAVLNINTGSIFSWALFKLVQDVGIAAIDSVIKIQDGKFSGGWGYVATDGPRVLYNNYSYPIMEAIFDSANFPLNVVDITEAVSFYDAVNRYWCISFPSDNKLFCYSLMTEGWIVKPVGAGVDWGGTDDNNTLMISSNGLLHNLNGVMYGDNYITPVLKTHVITGDGELILNRIGLKYRADTTVRVQVYLNRSVTPAFELIFEARAILGVPEFYYCPHGTRAMEMTIQVDLTDVNKVSNTYFEVADIIVEAHLIKSI